MKQLSYVLLAVLLYSCGTSMKGKIEDRGGKFYLVNSSQTKVYQFTVKKTTTINDSTKEYITYTEILAPGQEKTIGQIKEIKKESLFDYSAAKRSGYSDSEIVHFLKQKFEAGPKSDTTFDENGYPIKESVLLNSYQITGQIEVDISKYISEKGK